MPAVGFPRFPPTPAVAPDAPLPASLNPRTAAQIVARAAELASVRTAGLDPSAVAELQSRLGKALFEALGGRKEEEVEGEEGEGERRRVAPLRRTLPLHRGQVRALVRPLSPSAASATAAAIVAAAEEPRRRPLGLTGQNRGSSAEASALPPPAPAERFALARIWLRAAEEAERHASPRAIAALESLSHSSLEEEEAPSAMKKLQLAAVLCVCAWARAVEARSNAAKEERIARAVLEAARIEAEVASSFLQERARSGWVPPRPTTTVAATGGGNGGSLIIDGAAAAATGGGGA